MGDHYYSAKPGAAHDLQEFEALLRGRRYTFLTDAGVFSKDKVDFGSELLINTARVKKGHILLDLGCGYGPVGTSLAQEVAQVYMVDVNERAADLARQNLVKNGATNAHVHVGDGVEPVRDTAFHVVLLNPPIRAGKQTGFRLLAESQSVLMEGGRLWIVVQTKQGAPSYKKELARLFGNVEDVARTDGYHVFVSAKHGA